MNFDNVVSDSQSSTSSSSSVVMENRLSEGIKSARNVIRTR
jgi:hypothetical protein